MPIVDERVGRHDLDRGDAELCEVFDRSGMSKACEGPPRGFGDRGAETREAAQVELVDDQRFWRDVLMSGLSRGRLSSNRLRRMRAGVLTELEHRGVELERPVEAPGVRIGEQFGRVERGSSLRIVRALDAEAVMRSSADAGRNPTQDAVSLTRHRRASSFAVAI